MPGLALLAALAALLFALAPGCSETHGRGEDAGGLVDYLCDCCGVPVHAGSEAECALGICDPYCLAPPDGGTRPDAPLDPSCGARALDLLCLDHVTAGTPTTVSIALAADGCYCDQSLACGAAITGDHVLELTTALCPETPVCRACEGPPSGECTLPALTEGTWRVRVDGEDALDLQVLSPDILPERADVCVRRAIVDSCGAIWPPRGLVVGRACHDTAVAEGTRATIRVYEACGGCAQIGPCEVTVLGSTILVRASLLPNSCEIACPAVCMDTEHECITPPLAAGTYAVAVDGLAIDESTAIVVGTTPDPTEVCAGP